MRESPVLVTGATGNVGSAVMESLVAAGAAVRAAAGSQGDLERLASTGAVAHRRVAPVVLDFTDPSTWARAYRDVEQMFLLRPPQLGRPRAQMLPSLEAAKAAGVRQMVFLSLQGAEHNRFVPHAAIEAWLRTSGLDWTFVRASFFMQNLATTHLTDIRDRDTIMVPAGHGATAFVDAADVGAVAAAALLDPQRHRSSAWTPTGPEALTYDEVAEILTRTLGRPIRYAEPHALSYARHARRTLRMPWGMVAVTTAIYTVARLGRADGLTDDVREVIGRDPTPFETFARTHAGAWRR